VIVKIDDFGFYLTRRSNAASQNIGAAIVRAAPALMKTLAVVGTAAMFMVGGGILVHGIPPLRHAVEAFGGGIGLLLDIVAGIVAGAIVLCVVTIVQRIRRKP
jgi:hypothetical protein